MHRICWSLLLLLLYPAGLFAAPLSASLQARLQSASAAAPLPVIVRLRGGEVAAREHGLQPGAARRTLVAALKNRARQSQGGLIAFLRQRGITPTSLWLINGLAFDADPGLIAQLENWPEIELISENLTVSRPVALPAATAGVEWNIDLIGAPQLWSLGIDGSGVVVASLDTGVDLNHPDLSGRWRGGANSWFDPFTASSLPYDPNSTDPSAGHGTAVMGLMVGGAAGGTSIGVAPGAQWIAAKIFPDSGGTTNAVILQALGWVLDPDNDPTTDDGADVVNNSWGYDTLVDQCLSGVLLTDFEVALNNLRAADVGVVFSAGNTGPLGASSVPPGSMGGVLAVGAVDNNRELAFFSARGPSPCDAPGESFPSLVAPGVGVFSADLTLAGTNPAPYSSVSGTSFAAPQVAGALALLRQAFPAPTAGMTELESALQQMGLDLGAQGPDDQYGNGLLDVVAAYNFLQGVGPRLKLSDPVAPADDLRVDFASVPPGNSRTLVLSLKNAGGGLLGLGSLDGSSLGTAFSLGDDQCSGQILGGGQSCAVEVRFAPSARGGYAADLLILSDDPAGPQTLTLTGLGNTPPAAAQLLEPSDGAAGLDVPVQFLWRRGGDPDGGAVDEFLLISVHGDFSDSTPISAALPVAGLLLTGGVWGMVIVPWRRRRYWLLLALAFCLLALSCGGGGGSAAPANAPSGGEFLSGGLQPATTYYWKVRTVDSLGGSSESAVRTFTTR